jgi:hypothetical protein
MKTNCREQPFSYARFLAIAKRSNPHPGRFPDYVIKSGILFGWCGLHRAARREFSSFPQYKIGNWIYTMAPLRGLSEFKTKPVDGESLSVR